MGREDGGFRSSSNKLVGPAPTAVGIGDFDGDGNQDIALLSVGNPTDSGGTHAMTVYIIPGEGGGAFPTSLTSFQTVTTVSDKGALMGVGNLNGDALPDVVVAESSGGGAVLRCFLNQGDFSFQEVSTAVPEARPAVIEVARLNGDGYGDIVLADRPASGPCKIRTFIADGEGGIARQEVFPTGYDVSAMKVKDMNRDLRSDIVITCRGGMEGDPGKRVHILLGDWGGTFSDSISLALTGSPEDVAVGDLNGDAYPDIAVADSAGSWVAILLSTELPGELFIRGDANRDGKINAVDALQIILTVFGRGSALPCADAADANDNGRITVADAIYILSWYYRGEAPPPPLPWPDAGTDPTGDGLGCP